MGFKEGVMLRFYFLRIFTVGHILFYLAPLFLALVALRVIKTGDGSLRGDLRDIWNSVCEAWRYGEI